MGAAGGRTLHPFPPAAFPSLPAGSVRFAERFAPLGTSQPSLAAPPRAPCSLGACSLGPRSFCQAPKLFSCPGPQARRLQLSCPSLPTLLGTDPAAPCRGGVGKPFHRAISCSEAASGSPPGASWPRATRTPAEPLRGREEGCDEQTALQTALHSLQEPTCPRRLGPRDRPAPAGRKRGDACFLVTQPHGELSSFPARESE